MSNESARTVNLWPTAARVLGIGRCLAYDLARRDEFPVPVIRVGHRYLVSVARLEELVGERTRAELGMPA